MEFQYLLMATYAMNRKLLMKKIGSTGLTSGQPKILNYLESHDGATQTEIAAACHIETASMTSALNGMENKGLIERHRLNGNKRAYYIFLTDTGKEMCKVIASAFAELKEAAFSGIATDVAEQFMSTFSDVYESLKTMLEEE